MVVAFLEARLHLVNGMTQQSWPKIKEEKNVTKYSGPVSCIRHLGEV